MKRLIFTTVILITLGCKENPDKMVTYLNGYWEIEKVTLPSGSVHTYNYNEVIDYFEVTDSLTGFRKKLKPQLDGTFETSTVLDHFSLQIEHDSLNIYYKTNFSRWKETILLATDRELKIINENKSVFLYKPYTPLNLK